MIPFLLLAIESESDREFMTYLFECYSRLMYYKIRRVIRDPWAVDDILQTTAEKLIHKIHILRQLDQKRLTNYVATAARNNAYIYLRDNDTDFLELDNVDITDTQDVETTVFHQEDIDHLCDMWDMLSEKSKYLLNSRYILGLTTKEIANELKMKPESVRMALTRARREAYHLMQR